VGLLPHTGIDIAYSVALTDHYFSVEVLNPISTEMKRGLPRPSLPPDQEAVFLAEARPFIEGTLGAAVEVSQQAGR
jgi:hypothetical protein